MIHALLKKLLSRLSLESLANAALPLPAGPGDRGVDRQRFGAVPVPAGLFGPDGAGGGRVGVLHGGPRVPGHDRPGGDTADTFPRYAEHRGHPARRQRQGPRRGFNGLCRGGGEVQDRALKRRRLKRRHSRESLMILHKFFLTGGSTFWSVCDLTKVWKTKKKSVRTSPMNWLVLLAILD